MLQAVVGEIEVAVHHVGHRITRQLLAAAISGLAKQGTGGRL
jgi:hypothetical protein